MERCFNESQEKVAVVQGELRRSLEHTAEVQGNLERTQQKVDVTCCTQQRERESSFSVSVDYMYCFLLVKLNIFDTHYKLMMLSLELITPRILRPNVDRNVLPCLGIVDSVCTEGSDEVGEGLASGKRKRFCLWFGMRLDDGM